MQKTRPSTKNVITKFNLLCFNLWYKKHDAYSMFVHFDRTTNGNGSAYISTLTQMCTTWHGSYVYPHAPTACCAAATTAVNWFLAMLAIATPFDGLLCDSHIMIIIFGHFVIPVNKICCMNYCKIDIYHRTVQWIFNLEQMTVKERLAILVFIFTAQKFKCSWRI